MTSKWGPVFWKFMHVASYNYPDKPTDMDKSMMKKIIGSYIYLIPCPSCRKHFIEKLQKTPLKLVHLKSKESVMRWVINIHNDVNKSLGKRIIQIDTAMKIVKKFMENNQYLHYLDRMLYYCQYSIPQKQMLPFNKKKIIQTFVKAAVYFGNYQIKDDYEFKSRLTYLTMRKNLIEKIKSSKKNSKS